MPVRSPCLGTASPGEDTGPVLEQAQWQSSKERCERPLVPGGIEKGAGNGFRCGTGYGLYPTLINQGVISGQSPVLLFCAHHLGSLYNLEVSR